MTARRAQVGLSLALLLLSIPLLVSEAPAGEKECLTQGLSAERDKNYAQAITRYQQCLSLFSQQIKTSISIYQKLLRVYQVQGQTEEIQRVVSYLKATYPTPECDLKDLERLAHMYLEYGAEADGRQLLARIVSEHATSQRPEEIKVALRAASKLLASYEKHGEREAQAQLIGHLQRHYPTRAFETKDTYDLAVIYLKYEDVEAGKALLQWIAERPGDDAFAKKALFLLGRKAMAARDCEAAIRHYRAYIERYPQNLFYVQKAYQRIVSCHWAAGRERAG
ncbi:MAG: hypothetical protein M5R38_15280 [Candidatus Methylomirabilis sp.]|nr:hypothetical protein [Candidatus Methylomirabilis sp.]